LYQIIQGNNLVVAKPISEIHTITIDRSKD